MTSSNLPDDVTHDDIDERFGSDDQVAGHVLGEVTVVIDLPVTASEEDADIKKRLYQAVEDGEFDDLVDATIYEDTRR